MRLKQNYEQAEEADEPDGPQSEDYDLRPWEISLQQRQRLIALPLANELVGHLLHKLAPLPRTILIARLYYYVPWTGRNDPPGSSYVLEDILAR